MVPAWSVLGDVLFVELDCRLWDDLSFWLLFFRLVVAFGAGVVDPWEFEVGGAGAGGSREGGFRALDGFLGFFFFFFDGEAVEVGEVAGWIAMLWGKGLVLLSFDVFCRGDLLGITVGNHYGRGCCGGYGGEKLVGAGKYFPRST